MQRPPLKVNPQFYNLVSQANVSADLISTSFVTMASERCVSVCDGKNEGNSHFVTVDLRTKESQTLPNKAESVLPHPIRNLMAVKAKSPDNPNFTIVHLYNIEAKEKILNATVPDIIKYWNWINDKVIGIVGNKSVFHISLEGVSGTNQTVNPEKITDREGVLANAGAVQIIGYGSDSSNKFVATTALSKKTEPDGSFSIGGTIQLTSRVASRSQFLEGYAGCFGTARVHDEFTDSILFAFAEKNKLNGKLTISEIVPSDPSKKFKTVIDMVYPDANEADFPIYIGIEETLGLVLLLTKFGLLFVFEISEGSMLLRSRVSETHLIAGCPMRYTKGCLALSKSGGIVSIEIDETALIDYIKMSQHIQNGMAVSRKLSQRAGLPGFENVYVDAFNRYFREGNYDEAAKVVAKSPGVVLRNLSTIEKFEVLPKAEGTPHPMLKFFFVLLENGKLNEIETKKICSLVIQLNKPQMIAKWVDEGKLHITEELGNMVKPLDSITADKIYKQCGSLKQGEDSFVNKFPPEQLISQLKSLCLTDPASALNLARAIAKQRKIPANSIAELFLSANMLNELTSFCLDYLPNSAESSNWQTLVLETNLKGNPSVAESILQTGKWTFFNRQRLAPLFEQKGLYLRALEGYGEVKDIKRILLNHGAMIPPDYIKNFMVNTLQADLIPSVLTELLKYNRNTKMAVEIAQAVYQKVGIEPLVEVFESTGAYDGVFFFLGPLLEKTAKEARVYHRYIEACIKCSQLQEVERVLQTGVGFYDPARVLALFQGVKLSDPKPMMILCDMNGYIKEMVRYLWENASPSYIEMYVLRVNQMNAGEVLGCLLDLGAEENYIRQLLNTIGGNCSIESLIKEFDNRNRLSLLENWLEQRVNEGNTLKEVHNSLAKLVIDFYKNPEKFLSENHHYDVKIIGRYAETRDPHLAYIAFRRDLGTCDLEIIELTNKNNLYRLQAKYLVERQSKDLWSRVLLPDNVHRPSVVEQVVSCALPESKNVDEVSMTVQAFIAADMPEDLLGLLEKIVLHSNEFSGYKKLQNLLIITAMRTDKKRVMNYLNQLDNYDGAEVVKYALSPEFKLYEEAFAIFKKMKQPVEAINVLIDKIASVERAAEFAEKTNIPEVWSALGKAYLNAGEFIPAVDAFVKAKDPSSYEELIFLNRRAGNPEKLLEFFNMARVSKKEALLDNEYIYALAQLNKNIEIETFVNAGNSADLSKTGERLYGEGLFEAARILYNKLKNNAKIASCLIKLGQYSQAIEFAKKANNVKTWKEIAFSCVEVREFKLAAVAGFQVVLIPDHLEELVQFYELHGSQEEIISILEQAVSNEKSHVGVFTELASLYAKYKESKVSDFIKAYFQKLNVSKLVRVCKRFQLWPELVYLHSNYKEYDAAVQVMIDHSPRCFNHEAFVGNLLKSNNSELIYRAVTFYIEEEPLRLNELLKQITTRLDFSKVVTQVKRTGNLPLIVDWLKSVQTQNNQAVNDAINQIYFEMEDYDSLRNSIMSFDAIDSMALAKQIEESQHPEFRRISSLIYRKNKKFRESIELSLADGHFRDAIETAQESKSQEIAEYLLLFFAQNNNKEFFAVLTYTCYELIPADLILEISWRYGFMEFVMPFMIQFTKDVAARVETTERKIDIREKKEEDNVNRQHLNPLIPSYSAPMQGLINPGMPALTNSTFPGGSMGGVGGMGGMGGSTSFGGMGPSTFNGGMGSSNFPPFR